MGIFDLSLHTCDPELGLPHYTKRADEPIILPKNAKSGIFRAFALSSK